MVGWHHWLNGHEFEQAPGVGDGQGSLACCSPWGRRVRHDWVTELNWIKNIKFIAKLCCWFHLRAILWAGDFIAHSQVRQLKPKQSVNLLLHLGPLASTPRYLPGILGMFTDAWGLFSVFVTPWTVARQAPLPVGFSRQEYWSGLSFPPPGDLPDPGTEPTSPVSPALQQMLYPLSHWDNVSARQMWHAGWSQKEKSWAGQTAISIHTCRQDVVNKSTL